MATQLELTAGPMMFGEIEEFGTFNYETQRYICRSLDVSNVPDLSPDQWARTAQETDEIRTQLQVYQLLSGIRDSIPDEDAFVDAQSFLFPLIAATAFDLSCRNLGGFKQYRFLYERLLGARVRPWLPSAFAAAAALPHFRSDERRALLATLDAALTNRWSALEPSFYPQWTGVLDAFAA